MKKQSLVSLIPKRAHGVRRRGRVCGVHGLEQELQHRSTRTVHKFMKQWTCIDSNLARVADGCSQGLGNTLDWPNQNGNVCLRSEGRGVLVDY